MAKIPPQARWQCFFCDERSEERGTGIVKRKYKLACKQTSDSFNKLGIRSFVYLVTTSQDYHSHTTTLKVDPHEMTHYIHKPLSHTPTYIDLKNRERIFETDLLSKVTDPANRFRKVAKLSTRKWDDLRALAPNILGQRVDNRIKKDVLFGLLEQSVAEDLLSRWNIT